MNKEELLQKVEDVIVDTFEIDRAIVKPKQIWWRILILTVLMRSN